MKDSDKQSIVRLVLLFVIVVLLWTLSMATIHLGPFFPTLTEKGLFGDSFGAINALFSGLAFAGVIYAILLQREELRLQREELKLTREELKRSADAHEESKKALLDQAKTQAQSARLSAYTALLNWEASSDEGSGIFGPSPEIYVKKIQGVLKEIDPQKENA